MSGKHKLLTVGVLVLASTILWGFSGRDSARRWLPWVSRSQCNASSGVLLIDHVRQLNERWCWVATVSEVLNWFHLPNADQCQIYDLHYGATSCQDMITDPDRWRERHNEWGSPEGAAFTYRDVYGTISAHNTPTPYGFNQITQKICPADGSEGTPFIWAYDNYIDNGVPGPFHDVVVVGYSSIPKLSSIGIAQGSITMQKLLYMNIYVHDPLGTLEPSVISYEFYAERYPGEEDVIISKPRTSFLEVFF